MKNVEVELKYRLIDAEVARARLKEVGGEILTSSRQVDTYYNPPHRSFLDDNIISEWLRLRDQDGSVSINFKRWLPLGAKVQTHCDEFESNVSDIEALSSILDSLEFKPIAVVDKYREEWLCGDVLVAIDDVVELGSFIEFEYRGPATNVETALRELNMWVKESRIPLGPRDNRGYPFHFLER